MAAQPGQQPCNCLIPHGILRELKAEGRRLQCERKLTHSAVASKSIRLMHEATGQPMNAVNTVTYHKMSFPLYSALKSL